MLTLTLWILLYVVCGLVLAIPEALPELFGEETKQGCSLVSFVLIALLGPIVVMAWVVRSLPRWIRR